MYNRVFKSLLVVTRKLSSGASVGSRNMCISVFPQSIKTCGSLSNITRRRDYCSKISNDPSESDEDAEPNKIITSPNFAQKELDELIKSNPEMERKLKIIQLEVDVLRHEGARVPDVLKPQFWLHLLTLTSRSTRRKYLTFLWVNERKKENEILKKETARKERLEKLDGESIETGIPDLENVSDYRLNRNTMFLRIYDSSIHNRLNHCLIQAMQFGQKLVVDMSYEEHMTLRENYNCAKQLTFLFAENRIHDDPFNVHFCNANKSGKLVKKLQHYIPTLYDAAFPINITDQSYLDLFDKQQLVYLTPHCRAEMDSFDHDTVYIIGAMVDKVTNEPLSLAKAKKEGLRMAKFPLDRYLAWGAGSGKSLTLNQVLAILLELKRSGDWNEALKHVPRRKLGSNRVEQMRPRSYAIETRKWGNNNNSNASRKEPTGFSMEERMKMFRKASDN